MVLLFLQHLLELQSFYYILYLLELMLHLNMFQVLLL